MSKKLIWGIIVVAVVVVLLTHSKTETHTSPAVVSTPSNSYSPAIESDHSSATRRENPTFAESPCTSDCSGHEAGYNWADEHGIDDESDCDTAGDTSNSPSFAEGCRDYVQENGTTDDTADDDPND